MVPAVFALALASATPASPCPPDAPPSGRVDFADSDALQCFVAPDGTKIVIVRLGEVRLLSGGVANLAATMDGGRILWSPNSDGFAIADQLGSGQTGQFSYVDALGVAPRASRTLAEAGIERFKASFRCEGPAVYVDTFMDGWLADGRVRLIVQDGVHGEGCAVQGGMIGVLGDPRNGRIERILSRADVLREWCTAEQRLQKGYCHDEAATQR